MKSAGIYNYHCGLEGY